MPRIYFTGDDIPVECDITDSSGGITPTSATIKVTNPVGVNVVAADTPMTITANRVSYTISNTVTTVLGSYYCVITVTLPSGNIAQATVTKQVKGI